MSIDSDCGIMVGLPYDEVDIENLYDLIENGDLEISSLYYDSAPEENIVGCWLYYGHGTEINPLEFEDRFIKARRKFFKHTNLEPKIFTVLHIT